MMRWYRFVHVLPVLIALAAVGLAPPAAAEVHVEQYIEVAQCEPATGQDCPQHPSVNFHLNRTEDVVARFTANANGCSDADIRFLRDNYPQSDWMRISPSGTVSATM